MADRLIGELVDVFRNQGATAFAGRYRAAALIGVGVASDLDEVDEAGELTVGVDYSALAAGLLAEDPVEDDRQAAGGLGETALSDRVWLLPLGSGQLTLGRAEDNDIIISEDSISSHHCRFDATAETFALIDVGATNGTWIDNLPVLPQQPYHLRGGERLLVGRFELRFVYPAQLQHLVADIAEQE